VQQLGKSEVLENTVQCDGDEVWASQVGGERFLRVVAGTDVDGPLRLFSVGDVPQNGLSKPAVHICHSVAGRPISVVPLMTAFLMAAILPKVHRSAHSAREPLLSVNKDCSLIRSSVCPLPLAISPIGCAAKSK